MERHYLSEHYSPIVLIRVDFLQGETTICIGLLRVCASVLAQQNNLTVSLTRELQELISPFGEECLSLSDAESFAAVGLV